MQYVALLPTPHSSKLLTTPNLKLAKRKPIYDTLPLPPSKSTSPSSSNPSKPSASSSSSPNSPTPTDRLATQIGRFRLSTYRTALYLEEYLNGFMSQTLSMESKFTNTVAELAPKKETGEKLMPGLIYTLVATMSGSIISRNRGILLRTATPLSVGVAAGWYFIPVTMRNVGDLLWKGEAQVPGVARTHMATRGFLEEAYRQGDVHARATGRWVDARVGDLRATAEEWVRKGK